MITKLLILILINTQIAWIFCEKSSLITRCLSYNHYDLDAGMILSCNDAQNASATRIQDINKNRLRYFSDSDSVECVHRDRMSREYYNKQMIDAIRIENCHLTRIPRDTFKSYPYLRQLDMSNVGLEFLQPENFIGVKRSWELYVPNNNIKDIPPYLFMHAGSVVKVDLSYNQLKEVNPKSFVHSINISMLDLSGNQINVLNERTFNGLVNLTHMNLGHNKITGIDAFAFEGLRRLFLLDLSHNFISFLKDQTFANLTKLNHLQLSYNQINQIEPCAFATAQNLMRLDLSVGVYFIYIIWLLL